MERVSLEVDPHRINKLELPRLSNTGAHANEPNR